MDANHNNNFYIFVNNYINTMDEIKKISELITLIFLGIISIPFILITYLLIFILKTIESIWENTEGKDNI